MSLLHPWLLVGLLGATLPAIIHLIGRRRAPAVQFAAFDFLVAVNKRLARREKIRQFLLLLFRTLAVIALVVAIARPMPPMPAVLEQVARRLLLVVDTSASMAYEIDGVSLLERAKDKASDLISHLEPGDSVALVIAGDDIRVPFQVPTLDHAAVRARIDGLELSHGGADLGLAIDQALAVVDDGSGVTLAIVSDLSSNSFEQLRPTSLVPVPEVKLLDVAEREKSAALPNLSIERLKIEPTTESPTERRFNVAVKNYGPRPVEGRPVELAIDGVVRQRGYVSVPARGQVDKVMTISLEKPGVYQGEVRLVAESGDGYQLDDSAVFSTEVTRGVSLLAINGDPRTTPYDDELFFVERALDSVPAGDPPIQLKILSPDEIAAGLEQLDGVDVVLMANVGTLPADVVAALVEHVAKGGGLLFCLGDTVDFERVNREFGSLLPHPLRDLHRAADPVTGAPPLGVGDLDWDHPVLQGLGLAFEQSIRASRTASYFNLGVGSGLKARSVLRFDNGAPALVERLSGMGTGGGRVMLLTTSADLGLSDLPLRTAFPALMQRMVRYLAKAGVGGASLSTRVGGEIELIAPTGVSAVALISPSGKRLEGTVTGAKNRRVELSIMREVGIYRVEVLRQAWEPAPDLDVAVNADLHESDFLPVEVDWIAEALGGEANVSVTMATGKQADPFRSRGYASYFLLALSGLFMAECFLASRG